MPSLQPSLMRSVEKITGKTKDTKTEAAELAGKTMFHAFKCSCTDCRRFEALVNNAKGIHEPTVTQSLFAGLKAKVTRGDESGSRPPSGRVVHDDDPPTKPRKKSPVHPKLADSMDAILGRKR